MRIFRGAFRKAVSAIPLDRLTAGNYQELIGLFLDTKPVFEAFKQTYLTVGKAHGQLIGEALDKEDAGEKRFVRPMFDNVLADRVQNYLLSEGGKRIVSVNQQMSEYIIQYIAQRLGENASVRDLTNELQRHYNNPNFYRWQMERIVRTETTAAANYSALLAAEGSRLVLQKKWISGADARVRRRPKSDYDHLELNGKLVEKDGVFKDNGATLRFPGDPDAPAGAVINCRCTVAMVPKRDANGRLMRTGVAQQPMTMPNLVGPMERRPQGFVPAKTVKEAEERIMALGAKLNKVDLKHFNSEQANEILKRFENEVAFGGFDDLEEIFTIRDPKEEFAAIFDEFVNPKTKEVAKRRIRLNISELEKARARPEKKLAERIVDFEKQKDETIKEFYDDFPDAKELDDSTKRWLGFLDDDIKKVQAQIDKLEAEKPWMYAFKTQNELDVLGRTFVHELGHYRQNAQLKYFGKGHSYNWDESTSISSYGHTNAREYFAEWYSFWRDTGDDSKVPAELLKLFKQIPSIKDVSTIYFKL